MSSNKKTQLFDDSDSDDGGFGTTADASAPAPAPAAEKSKKQNKTIAASSIKKTMLSFDDDDDEDDSSSKNNTFHVNKSFADKYEQVKRKQELQTLSAKYGSDFAADGADGEDDEEEDEEGNVVQEDEDADLITDEHETEFASLLIRLRRNDPEIKDPSSHFFSEVDEHKILEEKKRKQEEKEFTLKDEYQRRLDKQRRGEIPEDDDEDDAGTNKKNREERRVKARTAEEKKAKEAFLSVAAKSKQPEDEDLTFTVRKPELGADAAATAEDFGETPEDIAARKARKKKKKLLEKAFAIEDADDADEAFLKNFFREERWKQHGEDEDGEGGDSDDEDAEQSGGKISNKLKKQGRTADGDITWEEAMKEEQDDRFFEDAESWEHEYQQAQYRHQEGQEALKVQTFPRQQDGLLREKDTTRKDARERRLERKTEVETRVEQDVKRLKTLKRQEIEEQQSRVAAVAGIPKEKMAKLAKLLDEELTGGADFDSGAFDKAMQELFDDEYYDGIGEDELDVMEKEQDADLEEELEDDEEDQHQGGGDDDGQDQPKKKQTAAAAQDDDDEELLYPTRFAEKHMSELVEIAREEKKQQQQQQQKKSSDSSSSNNSKAFSTPGDVKNRLQRQLDSKVAEYWKLHHEDVLADGTRTRFKYRSVAPETFGLSEEDVLTTDDRTLNMVAPMNCYAAYLTSEQNRKDRYKAQHRAQNMRFLDPSRKSRRYKNDTVAIDVNAVSEEEAQVLAQKAREAAADAMAVRTEEVAGEFGDRSKKKNKNKSNNNNNQAAEGSSHAAAAAAPPQKESGKRRKREQQDE